MSTSGTAHARALVLGATIVAAFLVWLALTQLRSPSAAATTERSEATDAGGPTSPLAPTSPSETAGDPFEGRRLEPNAIAHEEQRGHGSIAGSVVLTDGSVVADMRLVALSPDAPAKMAREIPSRQDPSLVLGATSCESDGRFTLDLSAANPEGEFVLHQISHMRLGQDLRVYRVDGPSPIRHVVPGGALDVRVVDASGRTERGVHVWARFGAQPGNDPGAEPSQESSTDANGRVRYFFREPSYVDLVARHSGTGAAATVDDVFVDPSSARPETTLTLSFIGRTGRLRIEVVDRSCAPVDAFAAKIVAVADPLDSRFVYSAVIAADGFIDGLPLERLQVSLAHRFALPPHLYAPDSVLPRFANLDVEGVATVRFEVDLVARLAFDLRRTTSDAVALRVRCRYEDEPDVWTDVKDLWQFADIGETTATNSRNMSEPDRYYTDVMRPGSIEVEVLPHGSDEPVKSARVQLRGGSIEVIDLAF